MLVVRRRGAVAAGARFSSTRAGLTPDAAVGRPAARLARAFKTSFVDGLLSNRSSAGRTRSRCVVGLASAGRSLCLWTSVLSLTTALALTAAACGDELGADVDSGPDSGNLADGEANEGSPFEGGDGPCERVFNTCGSGPVTCWGSGCGSECMVCGDCLISTVEAGVESCLWCFGFRPGVGPCGERTRRGHSRGAAAGRWDVVAELARELEARRRARADVTPLRIARP
jgi:hypothetical protein